MLPLELWLIIFKYTDKCSFKAIMTILYNLDSRFAESLKSLVCRDLVKSNNKIMLMIKLVNNYSYFRRGENYMLFRSEYILDQKYKPFKFNNIKLNRKNVKIFRSYIIENWRTIFNNDERRKIMFMNQTRERMYSYDNCDNYIMSDNNELPVEDVVKYTIQ
jgi:hypothetical protein